MGRESKETINQSDFIQRYKEYESVLRGLLATTPYEYENRCTQPLNTKLQIIRLNRNYIQHESDPEFVKISWEQCDLLNEIIRKIKRTQGCAKDRMIPIRKYPHLYDDMTVSETVSVFAESKTDQIPVLSRQSGRFLGICTSMQFLKYMDRTRGTTKLVPQRAGKVRLELNEAPTIEPDAPLCDLEEGQVYIVTKGGKVVGVLESTA